MAQTPEIAVMLPTSSAPPPRGRAGPVAEAAEGGAAAAGKGSKMKVAALVLIGLLVVAAVAIGLGVGLTRDDDDGGASPSTAPSTAQQDAAPGDSAAGTRGAGGATARAGGTATPGGAAPPPTILAPAAAAGVATPPGPAPAPAPTPAPAPAPGVVGTAAAPTPGPAPAPALATAPAPAATVLGGDTGDYGEPAFAPGAVLDDNVAPAPAPLSGPGPDGRWPVCQNAPTVQWGATLPEYVVQRNGQPCKFSTSLDGTVMLEEYFGGFDGFFSVDPGDGHEDCFNGAVADLLGESLCRTDVSERNGEEGPEQEVRCREPRADSGIASCVCLGGMRAEDKPWPGNANVIAFLTQLRNRSAPVDYEYPRDEAIADGGGRMANVLLVQSVMQNMIVVQQCAGAPAPFNFVEREF